MEKRFPHPMTYLWLCHEIIERVHPRPTHRPDTDRIDRLMMHEQKENSVEITWEDGAYLHKYANEPRPWSGVLFLFPQHFEKVR